MSDQPKRYWRTTSDGIRWFYVEKVLGKKLFRDIGFALFRQPSKGLAGFEAWVLKDFRWTLISGGLGELGSVEDARAAVETFWVDRPAFDSFEALCALIGVLNEEGYWTDVALEHRITRLEQLAGLT